MYQISGREIIFSRHALRRLKLYDISKEVIVALKARFTMKVYSDNKVDALYIKLSNEKPDGVREIVEGVNLDLSSSGKIVGIEILDSSKKVDLNTVFTYQLKLDKQLSRA